MSERDELADLIESGYAVSDTDCPYDHAPEIADAILAAGYRKPRTITTTEELDQLPGESVVRDNSGMVYELDYVFNDPTDRWWIETGHTERRPFSVIDLPATVLYEPAG
jgi:hypothetical protein